MRSLVVSRHGFVCLALVLGGCSARVGHDCDEALARTVVYDESGSPAYAGQALLIGSCAGGGNFCHADSALRRYGAPYGMNFDPTLADDPRFSSYQSGLDHLYEAQVASHRFRNDVFSQVQSGLMPPRDVGDTVSGALYRQYRSPSDPIGTALPSIRSAEGREILRNWLACRSPVVEATTPPLTTQACRSDDDCGLTHRCDTDLGGCIGVGAIALARTPTTANWSSLYATVLAPACAVSACHGAAGAANSGALDLSSSATAYAAMVGVSAANAACGTRIVAGDPTSSFLVAKLEGTQDHATCGATMPSGRMLSAGQIALFRTWITNGAPMD